MFGSSALVSGWGYRQESEPTSVADILQFATLTIFTNEKCMGAYKQWFQPGIMFCAGVVDGGKDACQGKMLITCCLFHLHISVILLHSTVTFDVKAILVGHSRQMES